MGKKAKLIELICESTGVTYGGEYGDVTIQEEIDINDEEVERIADHLIASGVTVGKPLAEYLHPIDNYAGLKGKYLVFKADTGEQVTNCFVLRPDKNTAAVESLRAYARNTNNETLAEDIYNWVGKGEPVQEWISVKDRLPEKKGNYLGWTGSTFMVGYYKGNAVWWIWSKDVEGVDLFSHWMPLPQPPKGD